MPNYPQNLNFKETLQNKKNRVLKVIDALSNLYPDARCHLIYENPLQLLISTILAAQCTDERVNLITRNLYKKYKVALDFVNVCETELMDDLKSINFYKNKTKSIKKCCQYLVEKFNGEVPKTLDELILLPGVWRKTANVLLAHCFGQEVIITDTHLIRIAQRLKLVDSVDADIIESELKELVPTNKQTMFSLIIGEHGRYVCRARNPDCENCAINNLCPSRNLNPKQ